MVLFWKSTSQVYLTFIRKQGTCLSISDLPFCFVWGRLFGHVVWNWPWFWRKKRRKKEVTREKRLWERDRGMKLPHSQKSHIHAKLRVAHRHSFSSYWCGPCKIRSPSFFHDLFSTCPVEFLSSFYCWMSQ